MNENNKPELISQTKEMLQDFLDALLRHPLFGCCELVYHFLNSETGGKKEDKFTKRLKAYVAMPMPREVEDMRTDTGEARVAITKETVDYVESVNTSALRIKDLYQE